MPKLGDRLRAARERLGITQTKAAEILGVHRKTFGGWENDLSEPGADNLAKLAALYNVTIDYLVTGKNPTVTAAEHRADLADVLRQMDSEFERVEINDVTKERIKEMVKLMMWDDIQNAKKKPD